MRNRLVASLLVALLAPASALACAMPRHLDAKELARVMADIDAAATPVPPAPSVAPAPVPAPVPAPPAPDAAPASIIPEASAGTPRS